MVADAGKLGSLPQQLAGEASAIRAVRSAAQGEARRGESNQAPATHMVTSEVCMPAGLNQSAWWLRHGRNANIPTEHTNPTHPCNPNDIYIYIYIHSMLNPQSVLSHRTSICSPAQSGCMASGSLSVQMGLRSFHSPASAGAARTHHS